MDSVRQDMQQVRQQTHRAARCPWCGGSVIRDDGMVEGCLRRRVACLCEDSCGWAMNLDEAVVAVDGASPTGSRR